MAEQIDVQALSMVTTTVGSAADARWLAQAVVQARLAACVQVEVITSHYHWQGALQEEQEWRLVCKTLPRRHGCLADAAGVAGSLHLGATGGADTARHAGLSVLGGWRSGRRRRACASGRGRVICEKTQGLCDPRLQPAPLGAGCMGA
jgi:hypothetical protein